MSGQRTQRLHVICDRFGVWRVELEPEARVLSKHRSASEAEWAAARHAVENGADDIVVHDRYDRVHRQRHPHE